MLAAIDLATIAYWTWIVIKVAIGLGAVIFVHELGHFLVAKACGVKCEKFFIGFDIGGYKISRRWGETEYGIGILPLGGYVKMLGQDDDPAHIAEQMKKSQVDAASADAVEITGPRGEKYIVDRRSYLAKSVPQRMAIISAGVIMNVIFAFIFAFFAYGLGVRYQPSVVSQSMPGSPAYVAGLGPDDEFVRFGNRENPTFNQLRGDVTLGDKVNGIPTVVRRPNGETIEIPLKPMQGRGLAKIGIVPGSTINLYSEQPAAKHSPAARAKFVAMTGSAVDLTAASGELSFPHGGTIVRIGDVEIDSFAKLQAELARQPERALRVTVRRSLSAKEDAEADDSDGETNLKQASKLTIETTFEVPPEPLRSLGLVMKMGPIAAIQQGSIAAQTDLAVGDVIELVDGLGISDGSAGSTGWDPTALPDYFRTKALENASVELTVRRRTAAAAPDQAGESRSVTVKPRVPTEYYAELPPDTPMGIPALGFAYHIENTVHAVVAGGSAAKAGIKPGDTITLAKITYPKDEQGTTPEPRRIELGDKHRSWPELFFASQMPPPGTKVELTVKREGTEEPIVATLEPTPLEGEFFAERGFVFMSIVKTRVAKTIGEQLHYAREETTDALLMVYRFLQKLGGQVPMTALGGPVTIAQAAGSAASQGLSSLLIFLTMLSANLAVINFLPIPLLDGGHMVFLLYEGIRGRPANERFVVAMHMIGFAFIVTLMLFVLGLDFGLIDRNL
jgi:regulator of sigma E protease